MKITGPLAAILLATITSYIIAQEGATPAYRDPDTGLTFPQTLGGLTFYKTHSYDEPGLGYSLRYEGKDLTKADIYVYDKQVADIPKGHNSKLVTEEAQSVKKVLELMQERGDYKNLTQTDQGVRPATGPFQFRWVKFEFVHVKDATDGVKLISETFITGFAGRFVKARLSYAKKDIEDGRKTSEHLVADLSQMLKNAGAGSKGSTSQSILKAIELFQRDPSSEQVLAIMRLIVNFAQESEDVIVNIDAQSCPWIGDREYKQGHVLLAAYIAGNIEPQLRGGQKLDHAYEGALQVISTYDQLRKLHMTEEVICIEEWIRQKKAGTLKSFLQKKENKPITNNPKKLSNLSR